MKSQPGARLESFNGRMEECFICGSFVYLSFDFFQRTLEREVKNCQSLIIWTDCDREGENIGYEIINTCRAGLNWYFLTTGLVCECC